MIHETRPSFPGTDADHAGDFPRSWAKAYDLSEDCTTTLAAVCDPSAAIRPTAIAERTKRARSSRLQDSR